MVLDMRVVVVVVDHVVMVVVVDLADRAAIAVHAVDHFGVLPVTGIRRLRRSAFPTRGRSTLWFTLAAEGMHLGLGPGWTQQLRVQVSSFPVAMRALNEALNLPSLHMPDNTAALRDTQASSDGKKTRKESNLAAVEQVINVTSLAGVSSCQELPSSWKYLVLASFLASNNPKDTDDFVFAMKKKGKRKKERTGAKRKAAEMENTGPQAFTFERLLSIFSQISIAGHAAGSKFLQRNQWEPMQVAKAVESKYGDAQLFAAVNDLEAQRFLTRASGWTLERPLYVSAVQEGMAREVSASINFDLNAYLH